MGIKIPQTSWEYCVARLFTCTMNLLRLHSANERDYIGYEISNCRVGQECTISIASYCEPKSFENDDRKVTCGCSSYPSAPIKCAPVSPPKSPKPLIKSISMDGIEIGWERAKEYSSAALSVRSFNE